MAEHVPGHEIFSGMTEKQCFAARTRLAHCVLTANVGLPHRSIREAIALAIHLIVHVARIHGCRRLTEVVRLAGYDARHDRFVLTPLPTADGGVTGVPP